MEADLISGALLSHQIILPDTDYDATEASPTWLRSLTI
jgi:hypothetical protein